MSTLSTTVSFERMFFAYILKNPRLYNAVETHYFKNPDIQFVFNICKNEYRDMTTKEILKPKRVVELVKLADLNGKISNDALLSMLKVDLDSYANDQTWIENRLESWRLNNAMKSSLSEAIESIRDINNIESLEEVQSRAGALKSLINEACMIRTNDIDLGASFNDTNAHIQDSYGEKVTTGFTCMDQILAGGWDKKTLHVIMGETGNGKSLWMQNMAVNAANAGFNVVYFTLEMSQAKTMKRLGTMRLEIPIAEYDQKSKDSEYMQSRIDWLNEGYAKNSGSLSRTELGDIRVKEYAAGTATLSDFDVYLSKLKEHLNFVPDVIFCDYIQIMAPEKGLHLEANLYLRGKHLAEGLRALAFKNNCPLITAVQMAKEGWGANDVSMNNVPESKAIVETSETLWGIIRNPEMKKVNRYRLKALKLRDGDFSKEQIMFDLDPTFLKIVNDRFPDEA